MESSNTAIIFSPGSSGLSIIQILHANRIPCIAMDCKRPVGTRRIGTYSRYADYIECPDPLKHEQEFIEFIYDFCKKQTGKPVLFPTLDHWAICIARHKRLLEEVSLPCVGNVDAVELFVDKERFYKNYASRRIPAKQKSIQSITIPATWTKEDLCTLSDIPFPIAAKPRTKLSLSNSNGYLRNISVAHEKLRLSILEDSSSLKKFLHENSQYADGLIFQEYIPGMSDCMYSVGMYADRQSKILGIFTGKKIRGYPALFGDCTVGINHAVPQNVLDMVTSIVKETGYSGIAEFEFKKDAATGEFALIEVNPRPWSWIGITAISPDNLPLIAYMDLCGKKIPAQEKKQPNGQTLYVKILQDCVNCLFLYSRDYPPWRKSPGQWLNSLKAERVIYAEFNATDWPVAIIEILKILIINPIKDLVKKILKAFC